MSSADDVLVSAARLSEAGQPYALATVVDVRRPASTRRGDRALVTGDGVLTGWVGGACSEPIVIREALRCLADGQARLVRIAPAGEQRPGTPSHADPDRDLVYAESHCASEGAVEVLVEPQLPKPLLAIVGESPAARMLGDLARTIGWRVTEELAGSDAVVVATMGRMDEDMVAAALRSGAGYVGLIASARRASAVLGSLRVAGVSEEDLARVRSPAGLDLGPGGQEDIAVAILAELVAWRNMPATDTATTAPAEATDPVCGMTVATTPAAETTVQSGVRFWFCSAHCRSAFEADPARYAAASSPSDV